jgi:hypothetical protein
VSSDSEERRKNERKNIYFINKKKQQNYPLKKQKNVPQKQEKMSGKTKLLEC